MPPSSSLCFCLFKSTVHFSFFAVYFNLYPIFCNHRRHLGFLLDRRRVHQCPHFQNDGPSLIYHSVFSPSQVAQQAGLKNHGQIGELEGHYLLCSVTPESLAGIWSKSVRPGDVLAAHPHVLWHSQERVLSRSKRSMAFNDPNYPKQWHLVRVSASFLLARWLSRGLSA